MIGSAEWGMRAELAGLWQVCFREPERYPSYFLNNCFRPENCLVYRVSGAVAAAVYLLPAQIALGGSRAQAHYIFAAGTLPRFRSRGYMASLLAYAAIRGAQRGDRYSAVLPAEDPLYSFYERNGYFDYYKIRVVSVPRGRLQELASPSPPGGRVLASARQLNALRRGVLSGQKGSVLWSDGMFHFAARFGEAYGDRLVCSVQNGRHSYALCRAEAGNACSVREAMAAPGGLPGLAAAMLKEVPAEVYRFRLPAGCGLFPGEGEIGRCGMLRPIGGTPAGEADAPSPYLGLALD